MNTSGNRRIWIGIIVVLIAIFFIANSSPAKIPGIGPLWASASTWFKNVTGISLDQIAVAIWKLILWLVKNIFGLLIQLFNVGLSLIRK